MRRKRAEVGGSGARYTAAPSVDEGEGGGRNSGYESGYGGYSGYGEEHGMMGTTHTPSNEGAIPMKYYVRLV